jgi:hypothetical protein
LHGHRELPRWGVAGRLQAPCGYAVLPNPDLHAYDYCLGS